MTSPGRHRLAVDLGTSTTIAMMQWPDGRVRPLLFDGSPLLSSAVLLGVDGQLHTGRDAAHLGRGTPERLEPNPKRRIDDDVVLLGNAEVPVGALLSAVLGRVSVEARRVAGHLGDLTLTHPAAWGTRRCAQLVEAAERAGLGRGRLVAEPVAAATYFAHTMIDRFGLGSRAVVYDLGAGTCDITVLRRGPHGFDIVASDGLNDVGGLDVDAAIVAFLEATYGRLWTDAVSRRQVWEEVRNAKEMLSRSSGTVIAIPSLGKEAPLGREQFDGLIAPVLRPTIALAK
jgi:molecular chaperone DnaK (HSP70)